MRLSSQIAVVLGGRGFNSLINLLFVPYLARALPLADYGSYGQVIMATDFVKGMFAIGLAKIITVHLAKYKSNSGQVLGSNLFLGLCSGIIAVVVLYLSTDLIANKFENPDLTGYLRIYIWSILFSILLDSIQTSLVFFGKIKQSVSVLVVGNLFKIAFLVLAIQVFHSMNLIFVGLLLAAILQFLLAAFYLPRHKLKVNFEWVKEQFRDGLPLGFSTIAIILATTVDSFMISVFKGTESYAIYRNGIIKIPFLDSIYHSVSLVVMPALATMYFDKQKKQIVALKRRIISQSAALMYPPLIFILVFHQPLIVTYLSEKYAESAFIFFLFNIIMFWQINFYQDLSLIAQKTKYIFGTFFLGFLINVVLNYLLIPQFGLIGAVSSTLVVSVVVSTLLFTKTMQLLECKFTDLVDLKKLFKTFIIPSGIMALVYGIYNFVPNLIFLLFIGGIGVLVSYFIYLKNDLFEKEIIIHLLNKIPFLGSRLLRFIK